MYSSNKGKVGEIEFASLLREHGYDARRGQEFSGSRLARVLQLVTGNPQLEAAVDNPPAQIAAQIVRGKIWLRRACAGGLGHSLAKLNFSRWHAPCI